jgi:outer membrane protein
MTNPAAKGLSMSRISRLFLGLGFAALTATPSVWADELKIGFVSTERIMRESAAAKAAETRLNQEFAKRDKELAELGERLKAAADKLERDRPVLGESDRARQQREITDTDREFQRRRREFQEDLTQRKNEELQSLLQRAQSVVRQFAEQEHYDVILQDAVYVGPRADVTDRVLKLLDAAK